MPLSEVTFLEGAATLGTAAIDEHGVASLPALLTEGTHTITAQYGGDRLFEESASPFVDFVAQPAGTEGEGEGEGAAEGEGEGEGEGEAPLYEPDRNGDGKISLSELLRVVQFFNYSNGYDYCPGQGTEDDFCPGP